MTGHFNTVLGAYFKKVKAMTTRRHRLLFKNKSKRADSSVLFYFLWITNMKKQKRERGKKRNLS